MKLPIFIFFITTYFISLKSMDLDPLEHLLTFTKSISLHHEQKTSEFDDDCAKISKQNLTMKQFMDQISDLTAAYEETDPFFFVNDCAQDTCVFTRSNNPHLRKKFEKQASLLLQNKITAHPNRPINYTSVCPSGILSELIILARTFQQHPSANINIHLIDKGYKAAIKARDALELPQSINSQQPLFLNKHHISFYLKNLPLLSYSFNKKRKLFISILLAEIQHKQFLSYLANTCYNANLSLYFYQSIDEYLRFSPFVADVLTTADLSNEKYDSNSYGLLCLATLYNNPQSTNIALDTVVIEQYENDSDNTKIATKKYLGPCIFSCSAEKINNKKQTKTIIIDYDNKEHTLYVSYTKLRAFIQKTHQ